jgi:localization factor PodJL
MAKTVNTENFPWSIKGISIEARKLAKEGAGKEGLTIGQWLKKIINEDHDESFTSPNKSLENASPEIAATKTLKSDLSQCPPVKIHDETMVLELINQIEKRYLDLTTPIQSILSQLSLRMDLVESKIKKDTLTDDL